MGACSAALSSKDSRARSEQPPVGDEKQIRKKHEGRRFRSEGPGTVSLHRVERTSSELPLRLARGEKCTDHARARGQYSLQPVLLVGTRFSKRWQAVLRVCRGR